jgi:hypothetical protein
MLRAIAGTVLSLSLTASALAWGSEGHRIVGTIASAALTESAAKEVRDLLGDQTIADACTWADEVRDDRTYDWIKPLHYINVPRGATSVDGRRDAVKEGEIVSAIIRYRGVLKDRSRPKEERLLALRLVMHLVGDIHQPFHVSYKDDKGGNSLTVQSFGKKSNMHKVWDTDLIRERLKSVKGGWATLSADLREAITADERRQWGGVTDPVAWANESFAITRTLYRDAPNPRTGVDQAYFQHFRPVLEQRLQAAGVRLAVLLNDALSAPGAQGNPEHGSGKVPPAGAAPASPPTPGKPAPAGGTGFDGGNPPASGEP